ncbi:oligopeptide ABC transporter substrate-binding protein OppA [Chelonobacter oris]|uniref:Peptide ABC transporter substrate-binding protein n=2 Tax=Chelonobacter oris TaxID=505317 RepID=A0A0A3BCN3_9PAST|nr:ABC transporter substrate-binding protein [Chelonobacter oris]KGQ71279.1 peptide ABC transporter substrate-binding protein [Chelonobacter oris]MDH3001607.1 oligopeptide ABC transporter substrate-binding protein OppA [Chelonobacter oris]
MTFKLSRLNTALSFALTFGIAASAFAANVPSGTELAAKQEVIYNVSANPATLDPQKMEGSVEGEYARQLFEGLVTSDEQGHILPGVAESWQHSEDFKVWTFKLRDNAKWSNGEPVTAEDFVYAWQRLADPKTAAPYSTYLKYLTLQNAADVVEGKKAPSELGVKALDARTLQINLDASIPYVDKLVEHYVLYPVHKATVEKFGDQWTKPENIIGNGAFKLTRLIVNEKAELSPNPNYWDNANTVLTKITLLPIESATTDVNRYRAGEIDISGKEIPPEMFQKLKTDLPNELNVAPILCTYVYEINTAKAPFTDVRVRQALSLALNRNIITDKVINQGQTPAYHFTPPYINGGDKLTNPEWASQDQKKRNENAVKLLAEAGFSKQKPLDFTILYNTSENHKKIAIAVASIWKQNLAGAVNVKMENQEWKTYLDSRHQGNYDVARAGWCADYNEATSFVNYFLSDSSNNTAKYNNPEYDAAVKNALMAESDEQRAEDYAKAEALFSNDVPSVPIYHYVQPRLIKPYVKGYAATHPAQNYYLKDVYLIKQ